MIYMMLIFLIGGLLVGPNLKWLLNPLYLGQYAPRRTPKITLHSEAPFSMSAAVRHINVCAVLVWSHDCQAQVWASVSPNSTQFSSVFWLSFAIKKNALHDFCIRKDLTKTSPRFFRPSYSWSNADTPDTGDVGASTATALGAFLAAHSTSTWQAPKFDVYQQLTGLNFLSTQKVATPKLTSELLSGLEAEVGQGKHLRWTQNAQSGVPNTTNLLRPPKALVPHTGRAIYHELDTVLQKNSHG